VDILRELRSGGVSEMEAESMIAALYSGDLGFAQIDACRAERTGYPEVVFCEGKTVEQAEQILVNMRSRGISAFATRAGVELGRRILERFPDAQWDEEARTIGIGGLYGGVGGLARTGLVVVATAGTSDLPAAKEAARTAEFFGSEVSLITDIGVAGIHRLFARLDEIRRARVIVAVAGMEGALAGVLSGLVSVPVIALPTSVGYGASFGGLAALLGMLTACAPGVSVVNIDNGFGAGYQANLINRINRTV
jgi:NCAIR mutase (PurE)-related protein